MLKKSTDPPPVNQVVALLAGAPVPSMLARGVKSQQQRQFATIREVATQLNTTPWRVRRIGEAFRDGGMEGAKALKWGAGRPLKQMNFAEGEIEEMVSVPILYQ